MLGMDRRTFLAASAGLAGAALSPAKAAAMLPVVDTHQHLWDLTKLTLNWLTPGHPLAQPFTPVEYAAATKGLNVVKSVYMEVDVVPEMKQAEADYVVGLCEAKSTTMVAAVIGGTVIDDGFKAYVSRYKGSKYVKGVRQVIHADSTPKGYCLQEKFVKGVQLLGELGLSFDICIRPAELPDAATLIDKCPGTNFILDHCGNANVHHTAKEREQWKTDMAEVAKRKNVVGKVSGFVASSDKGKWKPDDLAPVIRHTIDCFGWDRVMFGGDWPVVTKAATYAEWLTALRTIVAGDSEANQKKLFSENAIRQYGLS
jgi:predicted TIM-barrel fold metal-dependent hydrolase